MIQFIVKQSIQKYLIIIRDYASVVNSLLKRDFAFFEKKYLSRKLLQRRAWHYFKRNIGKQKFYKDHTEYYLKIHIAYNELILNALKDFSPEDYVVVNSAMPEKSDKEIFSFLTDKWRFKLHYFSFKDVCNKNVMSKPYNVDTYINDATLITKAIGVEEDLKNISPYIDSYQRTSFTW